MAKPLSNREMELFHEAVRLAISLDHCNPEVGMGPSKEMIARAVADRLSFEIDEDDIAEVCEEIRGS